MNHKINKNSYTYYDILQIPINSKDKDIKLAYLNLVKKCHPDLFINSSSKEKRMAELRFKLINEAYNQLKSSTSRSDYNKQIKKTKKVKLSAINDNKIKENSIKSILSNSWNSLSEILWPIAPPSNKEKIHHGR